MRLQDKVALITGSSRGIGRAIALRFAQEGASVIVNYVQKENEASSVVNEIQASGRNAMAIAADVSSEEQVKRMVEMALHAFGRIDIWVNNAGADILSGAAHKLTEEEKLRQVLDVDVKGTFLCCRAVTPVMQAQGSGCILNMSWDFAITEGEAGAIMTLYAAAKGAIHSLSMCLARELAPAIRVNVLAPGWMRTTLSSQQPAGLQESLWAGTPVGRPGEPNDVAEAALYLASPGASYVTGQTILVNGGSIMY